MGGGGGQCGKHQFWFVVLAVILTHSCHFLLGSLMIYEVGVGRGGGLYHSGQ